MLREDGRLQCECGELIPIMAREGYFCSCGKRHLFLPMCHSCGKYIVQGSRVYDPCPFCGKEKRC
jgi:hypothetical protein